MYKRREDSGSPKVRKTFLQVVRALAIRSGGKTVAKSLKATGFLRRLPPHFRGTSTPTVRSPCSSRGSRTKVIGRSGCRVIRELLQSANNFLHFRIYNTSV